MIILQSRAGQGRSKELIKRFIADKKSATLITDEVSLTHIYKVIGELIEEGYEINEENMKNIKTGHYTSCEADYYGYIYENGDVDNLYLDLCMGGRILEKLIEYGKALEIEYGGVITFTEQLPMYSDVVGVNVVEL